MKGRVFLRAEPFDIRIRKLLKYKAIEISFRY